MQHPLPGSFCPACLFCSEQAANGAMLDSRLLPHLHACLPPHIFLWHAAAAAASMQLTGSESEKCFIAEASTT